MTQTGPWSVKGIDQRARDAARDAAMAEGLTLGEYLNRLLLASDAPTPNMISEPFEVSRPKADAASNTLDRLTRRIEATEARSTLAITGMDHTVLGLVARLENAEQNSVAIAGHVEGLIDELKSTHEALQHKVRRLETDDSAKQNLEALKSLEHALGKLASHVYEENEMAQGESQAIKGRVEAGFADVNERVERMETKVERTLSDAAARVERAVNQAELRAEGAARHLSDRMSQIEANVTERLSETAVANDRLNAMEEDVSGAINSMETTLLRIQDRLNRAESTTDKAIQQLEATFDHLDRRITDVGKAVDPELAARLRKEFETRFDDMTRHLRETIGHTRNELAEEISRAAVASETAVIAGFESRLGSVKQEITADLASTIKVPGGIEMADVEARLAAVKAELAGRQADQARRLDDVADQIVRQVRSDVSLEVSQRIDALSDDIEDRLASQVIAPAGVPEETVRAELERINETVSTRLDTIAGQIGQRVSESEERQAKAIEQVGEQVALAANRLQRRQDESLKTLATQIDDNRKRADVRLSDALANVSERLELMHSQAATTLSPVQKAIASLATRLESLEEFASPPFVERAAALEIPPVPALPVNAPLFAAITETGADDFDDWSPKLSEPPAPALDPYADDYAAIRAASVQAAAPPDDETLYIADLPGEPDEDGFLDALSELGAERASSETRDSDIFDTETPEAVSRPRVLPAADPESQGGTTDYIARARRAAIAASGDPNAARRPSAGPGKKSAAAGGSKAPLYMAAGAAVITSAAVGGYLYLQGQKPAADDTISSASTPAARPDPAPEAPATATAAITEAPDADLFDAAEPVEVAAIAAPAAITVSTLPPAPKVASLSVAPPAAVPVAATSAKSNYAPIPAVVTIDSAASAGNHIAQYQLAEQKLAAGDFAGGAALMRKSAQKGLPVAQYGLARLHEKGTGVPKDITLAREWTEKAANGGNVKAMYNLAIFLAEGEGGPQSYAASAGWFLKSAEAGIVNSQYNLGMLYEQGLGVSANLPEALFWFEVAAKSGDKDAATTAAELRGRVSAEAAAQAKSRADAWKAKREDALANGRFGSQPWNTGNPLQIQGVQSALNALGFKPGTPDGVMKADTENAIRAYEAAHKLPESGTITAALIDSLNAKATAPVRG